MKKIIFSAAVAVTFLFASCAKKEHTCTCTVTSSYAGTSTSYSTNETYKDVTKKNAKTLCVSSTTTDATGATTTSDCSLAD
jgi:hypothetical protein